MADVFDRMANGEGFSRADLEGFLAQARQISPGEIGAVFGYLLGRLDAGDALAMVEALRGLQEPRDISLATASGHPSVSMVGTGGGPSTFNITTTASFVVAAAGPLVVKMGSTAWRSKSGSADVAAQLGVMPIRMSWDSVLQVARETGMVFVPPSYYPPILAKLAHELTMPTFRRVAGFINILGPLLSPVKVDHRFIGARSADCMEMLAEVCRGVGEVPTTFFSSEDGLDEVSTMAPTRVLNVDRAGETQRSTLDPASLQIPSPSIEELAGYESVEAAECCRRILGGTGSRAQTDIVALNAAAILHQLALFDTLEASYERALEILEGGEALQVLQRLRESVKNG